MGTIVVTTFFAMLFATVLVLGAITIARGGSSRHER